MCALWSHPGTKKAAGFVNDSITGGNQYNGVSSQAIYVPRNTRCQPFDLMPWNGPVLRPYIGIDLIDDDTFASFEAFVARDTLSNA